MDGSSRRTTSGLKPCLDPPGRQWWRSHVIYLLEGAVKDHVRRSAPGSKDLSLCFQRCWHLRVSRSFLKALSQHFCCYRRSLACGFGVPRVFVVPARWPATANAPSCACVCLCSTQWLSAALDLAGVVSSGCFATTPSLALGLLGRCFDGCFAVVVAGLLFSRCLAAQSMTAAPRCGCFAVGGVSFPDGCLAVGGSRADALPPWLFAPLFGRCFATESVLALSLGGCFAAVVA
jgi:hypothetical protein